MEYLVGDGPNNRYALICSQCHSHNGMALKEEFEYIGMLLNWSTTSWRGHTLLILYNIDALLSKKTSWSQAFHSKKIIYLPSKIIKFSTSSIAFLVFWLVHAIPVISSYSESPYMKMHSFATSWKFGFRKLQTFRILMKFNNTIFLPVLVG